MKNVIVQVLVEAPNLGERKRVIFQKCCSTVQRYAENIGTEYVLETNQYFKNYDPHFEIFRVLAEDKYLKYDNVLFVDADVFAQNTLKNLFDLYPSFAAQRAAVSRQKAKRPEFEISDDFFNSGIVLFTRESREALIPHYKKEMQRCKKIVPGRDQLALNKLVFEHLGGYVRFDTKHACYLKDQEAKKSTLVHVAGKCRKLYSENQKFWDSHFEV